MADTLQSVHDQGGIVVANVTEMNLLPATVKVCWMAGFTYRRNTNGTWVQDGADKVGGFPAATVTSDWNTALNTGFYSSLPGADNPPATGIGDGHWMGIVIRYTDAWVHQIAWPLGTSNYPPYSMATRARVNNAWNDWQRNNTYHYSWNGLDNLVFFQHQQAGKPIDGVRRFAHGMVKDDAHPAGAWPADEYRIQCYDTNGNFTWSAIKIPESGVVSMPKTGALLRGAMAPTLQAAPTEVESSVPVTIGGLIAVLDEVLSPTQKKKLAAKLKVIDSFIEDAIEELEDDDNGTE